MKVVHISYSDKGGAETAAYRIHSALYESGINSHFVYLRKRANEDLKNAFPLTNEKKRSTIYAKIARSVDKRFHQHLGLSFNRKQKMIREYKKISPALICEIADLPFSDHDILNDPIIKSADIIHLHWITGMLDYPTFFAKNKKPVVWTLHDMSPFQGLFHYRDDETKNKGIASKLDAAVEKLKSTCIKNRKTKLSVVCPSQWLLEAALNSNAFQGAAGYHIPYPLDTNIFTTEADNHIRQGLAIPEDHTVFLFVSQQVNNHRKGFDLLLEALKGIREKKVTLLVIGASDGFDIPGLDIKFLGKVDDERLLRNYYVIADAFIIPSREDNLPNVMLESITCGTPVLSFNTGGMREIISDGFNGLKAKEINATQLAAVIEKLMVTKHQFDSNRIRAFALENFSNSIIAEKYYKVYAEILQ